MEEDLIKKLKRLSETYKMYSDSALNNSEQCKLRVARHNWLSMMSYDCCSDPFYNNKNKIDDLEYIKVCEIQAGLYWSFHNEIELVLEKYDKPIDYNI